MKLHHTKGRGPWVREFGYLARLERAVGGTRDVLPHQRGMKILRQRSEYLLMLGDELEERRTPRIKSHDVEQVQRRHLRFLEKMGTECNCSADIVRYYGWTTQPPEFEQRSEPATLGYQVNIRMPRVD